LTCLLALTYVDGAVVSANEKLSGHGVPPHTGDAFRSTPDIPDGFTHVVSLVLRLLLGVVLRGARDSILAVALLHTMFNRSNNSDGIVATVVDGPGRGLAALAATMVLATVVATSSAGS
jgi:hypothetical protein